MGIFGWSYPPGCAGPPDEVEACEVCGLSPNLCKCPQCPVCGVIGRAECYQEHKREMFEQACLGVADYFETIAPDVADWADEIFEARDWEVTQADLNLLWLLYTEPMTADEATAAVDYHTRRQ